MSQTEILTSAGGVFVTRIESDSSSEAVQFVESVTGSVGGTEAEEVVLRLQSRYLEIDLVSKSYCMCGDIMTLA